MPALKYADLQEKCRDQKAEIERLKQEVEHLSGGGSVPGPTSFSSPTPQGPDEIARRRAFVENLIVAAVREGGGRVLAVTTVAAGVFTRPMVLQHLREGLKCVEWGLREMDGEYVDYRSEKEAMLRAAALQATGKPELVETIPLGDDGREQKIGEDGEEAAMSDLDHEDIARTPGVVIPEGASLDEMAPLPPDMADDELIKAALG